MHVWRVPAGGKECWCQLDSVISEFWIIKSSIFALYISAFLTQGFHWLHVRCQTALLRFCSVVSQHLSVAFQSAAQHSTTRQLELHIILQYYRIMRTLRLWNLWSDVDFRPASTHYDVFGLFVLLLTGWFNVVSLSGFLSCSICSAELMHSALASGKNRSRAYLLQKAPDCLSCNAVNTQHSGSTHTD